MQAPESENRSAQITEGVQAHNDPGSDSEPRSVLGEEPGMTRAAASPTPTSRGVLLPDSTSITDREPAKEELERTDSSRLLIDIKRTREHVDHGLVGTKNSFARVSGFAGIIGNYAFQSQWDSMLTMDMVAVIISRCSILKAKIPQCIHLLDSFLVCGLYFYS